MLQHLLLEWLLKIICVFYTATVYCLFNSQCVNHHLNFLIFLCDVIVRP